jgi:hypothetical protein
MVNVVMKAAVAATDAPLLRIDAAKGNESKAGICKTAPNNPTRRTPTNPDCSPTNLDISLGGTKVKSNPISIMMIRTVGRIRKKDLAAIFSDCFVFALSLERANTRQPPAKTFMTMAVELIFHTLRLTQTVFMLFAARLLPCPCNQYHLQDIRTYICCTDSTPASGLFSPPHWWGISPRTSCNRCSFHYAVA